MQTMNISLPDPMKQFVEEQVSDGDYSSVSKYVRELVRVEQKRREGAARDILLSAINSGDPVELTTGMIEQTRQQLRHRPRPNPANTCLVEPM